MKNNSYTMKSMSRWLVSFMILLGLASGNLQAQTTVQIGAGTTTTTSFPIRSCYGYSYTQMLYTSAEIVAGGYSGSGTISKIRFYYATSFSPTTTSDNWTVYLGNTALTALTTGAANYTPTSAMTQCFSGIVTFPAVGNWMEITLSTPFNYSGGNLIVAIDENAASYTCSAGWRYTTTSPTTTVRQLYSDTYNPDPAALPGSYSGSSTSSALRPNIQLDIISASPCAGQPAPGNTVASTANACSGTSVGLSLQNVTSGSDVSYVWEHSDDDINWTPFGTNSSSAAFTMGATPKYFHCIVSCLYDPNPGTSNSVLVGVNSFLNCYCASNATNSADTKIDSVELGTLYVGTAATACETYTNNTAVPAPVIYFNTPQSMRVRNGSCSGSHYGAYVAVFIDINQSGTYEDPAERVASYNTTTALNSVPLFNFTIPTGGPSGLTGMRVIIKESSAITACGTYSYGETEDYLVDLQPEPVCIDPPTAGSAQSNITQFCNTTTVNLNLSLTGTSGGTGQTYQWQYSNDDVDYYDIVGATTAAWTENNVAISYYYRCNVTCGASTVPSSSVFVEAVPPPAAGTISGPASAYASQAASYSSGTSTGTLQWIGRLQPSTTWLIVPGGTNDPQNIFFGGPGTYEVRLVSSVSGCTDDSSNIVTTVVTLQGDNVCDAVPVNIGVNGPYSNVGATLEVGESQPPATGCTGNSSWCVAANQTVWFSFTVPMGGSGRYGVGFSPGNWDSQVAVWSASACGDLLTGAAVLVAANDDSSGSPYNSYARAHCLTPGQTYYIQVDGYGTTTNSGFGLRIDDFGPADASFGGIGATVCENAGLVTLTPAVAGGTFSGTGVSGNSFDPALAAAGFHTITYTLGGLDICYSSNQTVEVVTPTYTYYADVDGDTYGNAGSSILSCEAAAPVGYSADATDCDDTNPSINPAATEICNSIDDDCDGLTDEGFDVDNDGYTSCGGDCNDNDNTVYPGATEVCNGVDDDCNLLVDDGLTFITYYADVDGDSYGDASSSVSTCNGAPVGYVGNSTDCDDNNAAVNPAATEICNLIDDDCNGLIDENLLVAGPISGPAVQCMAVVTGSATFSISPVFDASGYSWTVPNGMIIVSGQGTNSIFVSWAPQAVHDGIIGNLVVTPSNACGNGTPSSLGVDIGAIIPVRPSSISGTTKLCPGDNGVYSVAPVARASNYVWTLPAGMSILSGAGTNVITVDVSGGYVGGTVSCRAANACGISPNRDRSVSINVPSVSASISGPSTGVCGSTGVAYTAAAVFSATGYNWSVPVGATITSGQGTQSIVVDFDGAYAGGNVSVSATNACGVGSARNLNVSGAPGLPGVITGDITICPGQSGVAYGVSTVTGASTYLWSLPGGTTITSGQGTKDILATWGTNPASGLNLSVNASNGCGTSANRVLNGISISVAHCGPRFGDQGEVTGLNVYPNLLLIVQLLSSIVLKVQTLTLKWLMFLDVLS
ncbi:MAG: putative metal-binding motif-containing protein [Bacteroidetes bacterium]|nr:putative metal-binding motif-containing protein [Bacteroidota bacterium]